MTSSHPSPHSGEDTYDLIDNALAVLAERRGLWLGDDLTAIALGTGPDTAQLRFDPNHPSPTAAGPTNPDRHPARHTATCGHNTPTLIMRLIGKCGHNARTSAVGSRALAHFP